MPEPWFASTLDGITPVAAAGVVNAGLPVTAARGFSAGFTTSSGAESPILPVRTSGGAGASFALDSVSGASGVLLTYFGASSSNRIRIVRTAAVNIHAFQYWDGAAWVQVGATFALVDSTVYQARIEWSGYGTANGAVSCRVFTDAGEALIASRSATGLNFTSLSGIVQVTARSAIGSQTVRYSVLFVCDSDGDTSYVYNNVANANGSDTGGTGDFNSVNSLGTTYDSTFISLPTSGLRRSVKNTADRNYAGRTVRAMSVNVRLRRGATGPSQARVYLTIGGTRYYHPTTLSLTTSFTSYNMIWETDPSTSATWTLTNAQASSLEWGVEAV